MKIGKISHRNKRTIAIAASAGILILASVFGGLSGGQADKLQAGDQESRNGSDINIFEAADYDYILMYGSPRLWDDEKNLSLDINGDGMSEEFIISKNFDDEVILKGIRRTRENEAGDSVNFWTSSFSDVLPKPLKRGGGIENNCFVQISCCDIDEDGIKEVLVSAGNKQTENVTAIYEYSEREEVPFQYCGYIRCGTIVRYQGGNVFWAYHGNPDRDQYDEYIYKNGMINPADRQGEPF